jgi:hypothetical protein
MCKCKPVHVDLCRCFMICDRLWPVSTVAQQPETQLSTWIKYGFDYYICQKWVVVYLDVEC